MKENAIGQLVKANPIQTQSNPILSAVGGLQNEYKLIYNKGLQKKRRFFGPNKQTQFKPNLVRRRRIAKGVKLMQSVYLQRIMKNNADMGYEKASPNKPNLSRRSPERSRITYPQRGKTEVRCRMSEVRYLSSVFCLLSSVHGHLGRYWQNKWKLSDELT